MEQTQHTCPVWIGRLMSSSLRKLYQNPNQILSEYISSGNKILEIGPAMGFFSIPMAKLTGISGRVYCIDIQKKMLEQLKKKALKVGLQNQIETRTCTANAFNISDLENEIDFCLLFAVAHEVNDQLDLFSESFKALKPKGKLLFAEPKGHVSKTQWSLSISLAESVGFISKEFPIIKGSHSIVLVKP